MLSIIRGACPFTSRLEKKLDSVIQCNRSGVTLRLAGSGNRSAGHPVLKYQPVNVILVLDKLMAHSWTPIKRHAIEIVTDANAYVSSRDIYVSLLGTGRSICKVLGESAD